MVTAHLFNIDLGLFLTFCKCGWWALFFLYTCQPHGNGFVERGWVRASSWWCRLRRRSQCQAFSMKRCTYPASKSRQLVCHRFPTCGNRPIVSDAPGRCRLSLSRFVCTPSKLAVVLPPGTRALLQHSSTDPDRYAGMIYIRDQRTVQKLTLKPSSILGVFWPCDGLGVSCVQLVANSPLALWHEGVEPIEAGFLIQQQQQLPVIVVLGPNSSTLRHTYKYPLLPIDICTAYPKNYSTLECSYHQHCKSLLC